MKPVRAEVIDAQIRRALMTKEERQVRRFFLRLQNGQARIRVEEVRR